MGKPYTAAAAAAAAATATITITTTIRTDDRRIIRNHFYYSTNQWIQNLYTSIVPVVVAGVVVVVVAVVVVVNYIRPKTETAYDTLIGSSSIW
jgi:malate/lactate dehydrogenase